MRQHLNATRAALFSLALAAFAACSQAGGSEVPLTLSSASIMAAVNHLSPARRAAAAQSLSELRFMDYYELLRMHASRQLVLVDDVPFTDSLRQLEGSQETFQDLDAAFGTIGEMRAYVGLPGLLTTAEELHKAVIGEPQTEVDTSSLDLTVWGLKPAQLLARGPYARCRTSLSSLNTDLQLSDAEVIGAFNTLPDDAPGFAVVPSRSTYLETTKPGYMTLSGAKNGAVTLDIVYADHLTSRQHKTFNQECMMPLPKVDPKPSLLARCRSYIATVAGPLHDQCAGGASAGYLPLPGGP